jgi:hypothetical protein
MKYQKGLNIFLRAELRKKSIRLIIKSNRYRKKITEEFKTLLRRIQILLILSKKI